MAEPTPPTFEPPTTTSARTARGRQGWIRPALLVLLLFSMAWFGWRGPARAISTSVDFVFLHATTRAWLSGSNPYAMADVSRAWHEVGGDPAGDPLVTRPTSSLIYAPPTFVALAPFAVLPQRPAVLIWTALNIGFLCVSLWAIQRIAGLNGRGALLLWIGGFLFAPASTGSFVGQLSMLILALIAIAHLLRLRAAPREGPDTRGDWVAGFLIGLAAIIKPQMGLLFLVYEAGRLRYRSVIGGLLGMALLAIIGVGRLELAGIDWFSVWREHLQIFAASADGDASRANPLRHHLIHLAHPLHSLIDRGTLVQPLVYGIMLALSAIYFVIDLRRRRQGGEGHNELLSLSMTAVVSLLITYHRTYDAVLLLLPLGMALRGMQDGRHAEPLLMPEAHRWPSRRAYSLIPLLLLPFVLPGSIILYKAAAEWQMVPKAIAESTFWSAFVVPHATWLILFLGIWVTVLRARTGPPPPR